ncbi:hypothetical protein FPV67DRAFT_916450 [Lyophyllum atratum]|nr:hypothetical protein FPV67DRAFT_916450 [Lyophyllum atratum]
MSAYLPISLQPMRRSVDLAAGYVELPRPHRDDTWDPTNRWPKFISTLPTKIHHRASHAEHIAIVKALITPIIAVICFVFGHFLLRVSSNAKDEYRAPLYTSALAGLIGGQCMLGSVIIMIASLEKRPSGTKWYRYITLPAAIVIFAASAVAGPVGVMILETEGRPNSEILDISHAFPASGSGSFVFFFLLLLIMGLTYAMHRSRNRRETGTCNNCDCSLCAYCCDSSGCSGCDCNCDCGGC